MAVAPAPRTLFADQEGATGPGIDASDIGVRRRSGRNGTPEGCTEGALDAALARGGSVAFNCGANPATITVTSTKTIGTDTMINGGNLITISGGNSVGVFSVNTGVTFTVQNLTIANGRAVGGGGIANAGMLTVTNSTFSANYAYTTCGPGCGGGVGGAITNGGTLSVANSTFSANSAEVEGGGTALPAAAPSQTTETTAR